MDHENLAWYIVGLLELDGSFALPEFRSGRRVPRLQMVLKANELQILQEISRFLGVGKVSLYSPGKGSLGTKQRAHLRIDGADAVEKLIPFLDKHPFRGPKRQSYERWREAVRLIERGALETEEGRRRVREIAETINEH